MTVYSDFRFYPVGHGLFYAGRINRGNAYLTFVYDCGSKWDADLLNVAIERNVDFMACTQKLDYLFISHLHYDHISGIHQLIESFPEGVRALIMPYVLFAEYVAGMALLKEDEPDGMPDFMEGLDEIIKEKIEYLIVVGGQEAEKDDGDGIETQETGLGQLGFRNLHPDKHLSDEFFENYQWLESVRQKIYIVRQGSWIERVDVLWKFQWYVHPLKMDELKELNDKIMGLPEFRDCASSHDRKDLLKRLFGANNAGEKNSVLDKLKEFYECIPSIKNGGHNATSLVLVHRPMRDYALVYGEIKAEEILRTKGLSTFQRIPPSWRYRHYNAKNGTILFGDINLTSDAFKPIVQYFKSEWQHIVIATVPHHGSIKNWNEAIFDYLHDATWIASSRYEDGYHHPDGAVVYNILKRAPIETFIWNHENNMVTIHLHHFPF